VSGWFKVAAFSMAFDNAMVRGIVTAVLWLNPGARAFRIDAWEQGLAHVDLAAQGSKVLKAVERLARTMPPIRSVQHLLAHAAGKRAADIP
jgi:hypothetical protein